MFNNKLCNEETMKFKINYYITIEQINNSIYTKS